tara:strand:+ start:1528 stop:1767 length:240 start_codon:yes stop_codon:yes gene_type:complete
MKIFILTNLIIVFCNPVSAVTTKMFRVLDTCARYRLNEINQFEAIEKLKLKYDKKDKIEAKTIVKNYCSVFTPNQKIEF